MGVWVGGWMRTEAGSRDWLVQFQEERDENIYKRENAVRENFARLSTVCKDIMLNRLLMLIFMQIIFLCHNINKVYEPKHPGPYTVLKMLQK